MAKQPGSSDKVPLGRNPPDRRTPAVVIGLDSMQGLQAARILAGHHIPTIAIAADRNHHACRTNCCERIVHADTGSDELIDVLERIGSTLADKAVLFPCQDKVVRVISRHRDRLATRFRMMLPDPSVVDLLMDKEAFSRYAEDRHLPVPASYRLENRTAALAAAEQITYPCIIKPAYRSPSWDQHTRQKVFRVVNRDEFLSRYDLCAEWVDTLIAQQWVEGGDDCLYSCNCYFGADNQPLVTFVARKLRQWPPDAGSSCLGEEVRDDTVLRMTLELFRSVGFRGLGYLEIKRDVRSGDYFIIEPNIGRPTGRSAIAEAGGVALLYTMYCDVLGQPLPDNREQRFTGTKWIDLRHDLQSALHYWRCGELSLRDWLRSLRGRKAYAVFSWRDPAPFLFDCKNAIANLLNRRRSPESPNGRAAGHRAPVD